MSDPATRPRLVFANRFYWPDEQATAQLLVDLAEGLAARGWSVTVVTSRSAAAPAGGHRHGVDIIRVGGLQSRRRHLAGKALDYAIFSFALRRGLARHLRPGDLLIALTDPPSMAPLAATAARRAGTRLLHLIKDIHPEVGIAVSGSRLLATLSKPWVGWRDRAWRRADFCVTISADMASAVAEHGVQPERIRLLPDWAPGGDALAATAPATADLRRAWGLEGKFVVAYSGNLGRVHALEPLAPAAALLGDLADLVFAFVGDGPRRRALEAAVAQRRLTNVRFLPPQPRDRLAESLSVGDVHLVTLRAGCERFVYPSKLYGVLAVGRPIVFVGPPHCELAEAVRRRGAGLVADDNDPVAVAAAIRALHADPPRREAMGRAAAAWFRATGGLQAALDGWEKLLHELPRRT